MAYAISQPSGTESISPLSKRTIERNNYGGLSLKGVLGGETPMLDPLSIDGFNAANASSMNFRAQINRVWQYSPATSMALPSNVEQLATSFQTSPEHMAQVMGASDDAILSSGLENSRFYSNRETNADNSFTQTMWHIGGLASEAGHDAVVAGRGLYNIATDGYSRDAAIAGLQDTWNHLPTYAIRGMQSFSDLSLGQKTDAAIKFGFSSAISAGTGRLTGAVSGFAYDGSIASLKWIASGLDDFNGFKIGGVNYLAPIRMYAMESGQSLAPTGLQGSGAILAKNLGGVAEGYQAHHVVMTSLAKNSEALQYLAAKGLYDVNRASNGLALPGNQFLALADEMPLHTGFHGPEYRAAIGNTLDLLDAAFQKGASDTNLMNRIGTIEKSLSGRLLNGDLWLNNADAQLRNLGPYKK